jgi:hypothetical protein
LKSRLFCGRAQTAFAARCGAKRCYPYTDDPLDRLEKIVVALTSDIAESAKEGNHSMHDDSVSSSLMMTFSRKRRGEAYLACAQTH